MIESGSADHPAFALQKIGAEDFQLPGRESMAGAPQIGGHRRRIGCVSGPVPARIQLHAVLMEAEILLDAFTGGNGDGACDGGDGFLDQDRVPVQYRPPEGDA